MNILQTYEKLGKNEAVLKPVSKILIQILTIMKEEGYIGDFTIQEHKTMKTVTVTLIGKINKCAAITPNNAVGVLDFETKERRYLPAKGFGVLILTTPKGIMTHKKADELHTGGRLLAYCY